MQPRAATSNSDNSSKGLTNEEGDSSSGGGGTGSSASQPHSLDAKPNRLMPSHISEKPCGPTYDCKRQLNSALHLHSEVNTASEDNNPENLLS